MSVLNFLPDDIERFLRLFPGIQEITISKIFFLFRDNNSFLQFLCIGLILVYPDSRKSRRNPCRLAFKMDATNSCNHNGYGPQAVMA